MRFLFVVKQEKNAATYFETLRHLVERGHVVTLAIQERDDKRDQRLVERIGSDRFSVAVAPAARNDEWAPVASLLRRTRDCVQYLRPVMRSAVKLQRRMIEKVHQELAPGSAVDAAFVGGLQSLSPASVGRLEAVCALAEQSLPTASLFDEFLATHRPDVLLLSPLVHFGSAQADLVASARRAGVPVQMLLFSWDNLSTKGCLHRRPDLIYAWNERQRKEAQELHGFPGDRVVVVGAPRFDAFFALTPQLSREAFHVPLGLDPAQRTLLYVCSSRLVSAGELALVRRWLAAVRGSASSTLLECNVIVRPHPDIDLLPKEAFVRQRWPASSSLGGHVARPFDDPRSVVLETSHSAPEGLFESITHSTAVVGLNTTAELEAGIAGRPVFTIIAGEQDADGQAGTMHFHYLTKARGGFVTAATDLAEHVAQLETAFAAPIDPAPIRAFIESFVRPCGIGTPVAPLLADAIERHAAGQPLMTDERHEIPAPSATDEVDLAPAAVQTLPLALKAARIWVHATPDATRRGARGGIPLDKAVVNWLEQYVTPGEVVYEVNAGMGTYTLIAAKHRGAVVVAFEPAYRAYGELCDNVRLNACDGAVIPVPLPLSDREALADVRYALRGPGDARYRIGDKTWRVRPTDGGNAYAQPACVTRLDMAVARYGLPLPNHIRLSSLTSAERVLRGAGELLRHPGLATLAFSVPPEQEQPMIDWLAPFGWQVSWRRAREDTAQIVAVRPQPAAGSIGSSTV